MLVVLDGSPKSEVVVAAPDFQFQPSLSRVSLESSFNLKDDLPETVGSRQPNNGSTGQPKSPETQTPAEHWSPRVTGSPSLQDAVLSDVTQPLAESQLSSVQASPSSQTRAAPPTHTPPEQASSVVQASPSSQATSLLAEEHPLAGSQLSSVHKLPSSQSGGRPPTQAPALQLSPVVQALPSSQVPETLTLKQPPSRSQLSSVQVLPSSQSSGAPPAQAPALQVSAVVQALPSSQTEELFE
jgi:hypothetical protein